jgi:hypothetical protein
MIGELEGEGTGEVLDRAYLFEDLTETFVEEPLKRLVLDSQQIGERQDLGDLPE